MSRFFVLVFLLFSLSLVDRSAFAESGANWSQWQDARTLYEQGKFEDAFKALSAQPSTDAFYFYNLGTIAYRLGRTGAALGYFEKANRLKSHDPDIRHNLEAVKADLSRTLGTEKLDPASSWAENLADHVSLEELRGVLGLMGLILSFFWIQIYRKSRSLRPTLLHPAGLIGSAMLAVLIGLYGLEIQANSHSPAVALLRETIRSGPGDTFVQLSTVEAGTKVRLLGPSTNSWFQVRFSRDGVGWIPAASLVVID